MSQEEQEEFIKSHLYNELRWLLCAAASWKKAKQTNTEEIPAHFVVYTMDSAFLHARSLFEFFTHTNPEAKAKLITWKNFGLKEQLRSDIYKRWIVPLHHHVMHLENRLNVNNVIDGKHLNSTVFEFAIEIVRLWIDFSNKIDQDLKVEMDNVLENSIKDAEKTLPQIRNLLLPKLSSEEVRV